ncbi:hypothetical protein CL619_02855 [archaeon]|nr:hypothetical protein [archaeon]|tara:strand:- start:7790 stop:8122 length:333 start_codon:yes stop_codon:yes gene_type:complete
MDSGLHHQHLRKRIHLKKQKYPHPNKYKAFMDKIIFGVGVAGPIMTIPQLWQIWYYQNATGVSFISWFAYLLIGIIWLIYGIMHQEWPIIVTYIAWIIIEIPLVIGIILF